MNGRAESANRRPFGAARPQSGRPAARAPGAVLLEVILALALFVTTSGVVLASLSACLRAAQEVRLEAEAADLAVTRLSEVQMGVVPLRDAGPEAYEPPLAAWTWQVTATPVIDRGEDLGLKKVEIVITQTERGYVYRLGAWVLDEEQAAAAAEPPATSSGAGP